MWKKENLQAATTLPFDVKTEELEIETKQTLLFMLFRASSLMQHILYSIRNNKAFNGLLNIPSCGFFSA